MIHPKKKTSSPQDTGSFSWSTVARIVSSQAPTKAESDPLPKPLGKHFNLSPGSLDW